MTTEEKRDDLESRRFRMDTTVNITHILTTIGLIVTLFTWGSDVKEMLARHDEAITSLKEAQIRDGTDVKQQLLELNRKIDRLIERSSTRR